MTKYFLHGGGESKTTEDNKKFFQELVQELPEEINILCVYIARDKRLNVWDWNKMFEDDKRQISSACPEKTFDFVMAEDKTSAFTDQIKNADIVYLRGGITDVLLEFLKEIPDIDKIWGNKIVAGCSAAALVLSQYYYDGDLDAYKKGLGILPIKIICHWGEERYSKLEGLKKFGEDLEIYKIPEQKFFIIEQ
ncbi:Type 1 glutamine amidotransferase-like domain-containing protein [Patescibacteria group bacterium]|nr:Type 1 glutamine amidotransferase-like domain-containing protein [Patescibacteria group bacterium]MBU1900838.1 Type 1 glutamine amidotransferase-like domain-containing protein [Patescibacteria group bacterium]